ncbi:MAG: glycoside hydrolase family 2 TIM barrel-domain containing protein [Anaerolineae bacterium]
MTAIDLDGEWYYKAEDNPAFAGPELNHEGWPRMDIPQNWFLAGLDHHGVVWFRRSFTYNPRKGYYATLCFDGVDYFADVYLNGVHLGHHEGYFEPFRLDATGHLREGDNILAVRVESPFEEPGPQGWHMYKRLIKGVLNHHDCRPGGGWSAELGQSYNTGGIWNSVRLVQHGPITIEQVMLEADLESNPPVLYAIARIKNRLPPRVAFYSLHCAPENFDLQAGYSQQNVPFVLPHGESLQIFPMAVSDVRRWEVWERGFPHLYRVTLDLADISTTPLDSTTQVFGFRTVEVDEGYRWRVNGRPFFPRGSNYIASQWLSETISPGVAAAESHPFPAPEHAPPLPDGMTWFERDVALMKQANLNTIRVHAHVLPPQFYEACDRAGLLVWQDFPLQWGYVDTPEFHAEAERQIIAMVNLLYSHPSIAVWCCHNESPSDTPWMAEEAGGDHDPDHNRVLDAHLEQVVRDLDAGRYVHRSSGTGDGHAYPGWYYGHWRDYSGIPGAPFPTEYGAQGLPVYETLTHMLSRLGPDAGYADLMSFRDWLLSLDRYRDLRIVPAVEETPEELHRAREAWLAWRFHDFQPAETFEKNGIQPGESLADLIAASQDYQAWVIQYATECYRRHKGEGVAGLFQFMLVDPWPAITWSVLDYWRVPKPSFEALRRAMQPVLPSLDIVRELGAGRPLEADLVVVNDLLQDYPGAVVSWSLAAEGGEELAAGSLTVDVPADGVSSGQVIAFPPLAEGRYCLVLALHGPEGALLGENRYALSVAQS